MNSLISIIIPVFNKEKYVGKAIESCIKQTYRNIEIILIDDGSTDHSSLVCGEYKKSDNRIQYFYQENNGASSARNKGLLLAKGDWIVFLDADDFLTPDFCETCLLKSEEAFADMLFVSSKDICDEKETTISISSKESYSWSGEEIKQLSLLLLTGSSKVFNYNYTLDGPCCKIIKKSTIGNAFFPEHIDLCEDTCFIAQVLERSDNIYFYNKALYNRVITNDSLSYHIDEKRAKRIVDYCIWMLEFFWEKVPMKVIKRFVAMEYFLCIQYYFLNGIKSHKEYKREISVQFQRIHHKKRYFCYLSGKEKALYVIYKYNLKWVFGLAKFLKNLFKKPSH